MDRLKKNYIAIFDEFISHEIRALYNYMQCHCDDDRRIIDLREYLIEDKHHDYLYSMFSDEYEYVNEK